MYAWHVLRGETAVKMQELLTRLEEIRSEQRRQSEFAGLRFGVFARLKELEREERRVLRCIEQIETKAGA